MTGPFPARTHLLIKIVKGMVFFEAQGTVVYSEHGLGMGIAFDKVHPYFLKVLQKWLLAAERERQQVGSPSR
jgi:hypothetical protein